MNTLPNIEYIESLFKQIENFSNKKGKLKFCGFDSKSIKALEVFSARESI